MCFICCVFLSASVKHVRCQLTLSTELADIYHGPFMAFVDARRIDSVIDKLAHGHAHAIDPQITEWQVLRDGFF